LICHRCTSDHFDWWPVFGEFLEPAAPQDHEYLRQLTGRYA
jgi:hypothetical protein